MSTKAALSSIVLLFPWSLAHAGSVDERRPADPNGLVEIVDVAGTVEVSAWDRPEVQVTGTVEDSVGRVEVTATAGRTAINVVMPSGSRRDVGEARLVVHVPAASAVSVSLVSADLTINGVRGDMKLQTVSGDVRGEVHGNLRAGTVSGGLKMTDREGRRVELKSISGDVQFAGNGADVEITTVSGTAKAQLSAVTRGRFRTVSGTIDADVALSGNAQLDGESVSGNVTFNFSAAPDAEFDVRSFSGEIHGCFGPAPVKAEYGPGSRLTFTNGAGQAQVHVETKSGNVRLCTKPS